MILDTVKPIQELWRSEVYRIYITLTRYTGDSNEKWNCTTENINKNEELCESLHTLCKTGVWERIRIIRRWYNIRGSLISAICKTNSYWGLLYKII